MTTQEQASKVFLILLQFSVLLLKKPKQIRKIEKEDRKFLLKIADRKNNAVSEREFSKLTELREKYLE